MCTSCVCTASSNLQACCEAGSPAGQEAATASWVLPACWYLCAPFPHLQCGTESPDKCLDHPKNNRSNTSKFPKFPPFIVSMQVLHAKQTKAESQAPLSATGQHCPGMELDIYLFALRGLCPLSHRHESQGITEPSHLNLRDGFSQVWHCTKSLLHKFHKTTCAQKGETRVLNIHTLAPITFDLTFSFYVVQAVADLHHHLTTKS